MSIINWPVDERPREKLIQKGPQALSDAELLAIFLRTGIKGKSAVDVARDLLTYFGSLRKMLDATLDEMCLAPGVGIAKCVQLQAALEMSRRYQLQSLSNANVLTSPQLTRDYLTSCLRHRQQEVFLVLLLNSQHGVIASEELFVGTIDAASVYPREVVKLVMQHNAAAVIFAHNHPSGIAEPSQADIRITKRLSAALELVDVRVLDHMVVGEGEVVSLAERGQL
ncbi:MAG: DNA repair protein RadC [Pseudomonadales bacterium]|jgi:DNA repair protein RadC